jgi:Mrp family chromosome partitioning ATPase
MPPVATCFAVLFGADPGADDLFSFPGVLKLGGLAAGAIGPAVAATWALARRSYRNRVRATERQAAHWKAQSETAHEQAGRYRQEANMARAELIPLSDDLNETRSKLHEAEKELQQARHDLHTTRTDLTDAQQERERLRGEVEQRQASVAYLQTKAGVTDQELDDRTRALARLDRRMKSALRLEGQLWNAKALQKRPKFRDLARRRRAVVSVLNLEGGVGKTTITAHLGAAFARRGYRVPLIDLDLQGSLTSLLVPQDKINQLFADSRYVQHFFNAAADDKRVKVTDYVQEVFRPDRGGGSLHVVGTTDNLAYAELNLTMRWLVGSGERDTRFLLCKALPLMGVSREFDLVLIDCPPLVNSPIGVEQEAMVSDRTHRGRGPKKRRINSAVTRG